MKQSVVALLVTLAALGFACHARAATVNQQFRDKAEEILDCLDGEFTVMNDSNEVFYPQNLQCRAMLRKLDRLANTQQETSVAAKLHDYQKMIITSHTLASAVGGRAINDEDITKPRAAAIREGTLRAPDTPGQ